MGNVVEFGAHTSIERQAREWLIRMDGDDPLSSTEREALREWTHRSALHRKELARLAKFWNQANVLTALGVDLESEARERTLRHARWMAPIALAASAALASVDVVWWNLHRMDRAANGVYGTVIGEQKTISLADGSSVRLNTDSQVQVGYSGDSRKIRLLRGEALFSRRQIRTGRSKSSSPTESFGPSVPPLACSSKETRLMSPSRKASSTLAKRWLRFLPRLRAWVG